jgi:hypothetical protein
MLLTAFCAASSRFAADLIGRPESARIFFASLTFVPENNAGGKNL